MAWDYVYESPIDYLIDTQTEKVKYEIYRVSSQLESVNKRLSLLIDEGKMNLLLFCAIFVIYGVSFLGLQSGSVIFRLICTVPYAVCLVALVFLTPVLLYKSLNGFLQYWMNQHSESYTQMMKKLGIQTYEEERRECIRLLTKYEAYMQQLEKWKDANQEGALLLTEQDLLAECDQMDLSGKVPVTNIYSGKMATITRCMTVIMWLIPLVIAISAIIRFAAR